MAAPRRTVRRARGTPCSQAWPACQPASRAQQTPAGGQRETPQHCGPADSRTGARSTLSGQAAEAPQRQRTVCRSGGGAVGTPPPPSIPSLLRLASLTPAGVDRQGGRLRISGRVANAPQGGRSRAAWIRRCRSKGPPGRRAQGEARRMAPSWAGWADGPRWRAAISPAAHGARLQLRSPYPDVPAWELDEAGAYALHCVSAPQLARRQDRAQAVHPSIRVSRRRSWSRAAVWPGLERPGWRRWPAPDVPRYFTTASAARPERAAAATSQDRPGAARCFDARSGSDPVEAGACRFWSGPYAQAQSACQKGDGKLAAGLAGPRSGVVQEPGDDRANTWTQIPSLARAQQRPSLRLSRARASVDWPRGR